MQSADHVPGTPAICHPSPDKSPIHNRSFSYPPFYASSSSSSSSFSSSPHLPTVVASPSSGITLSTRCHIHVSHPSHSILSSSPLLSSSFPYLQLPCNPSFLSPPFPIPSPSPSPPLLTPPPLRLPYRLGMVAVVSHTILPLYIHAPSTPRLSRH